MKEQTGKEGLVMEILSDEMLIDTYQTAVHLELEPDFLQLLLAEIRRREVEANCSLVGA
ncbi:sporulation histidine kinase inhibitor Sda [Paenibacillus sp. 1P07SE]|uniref:sporulation histidine kinase inhibitor Sda n=1 Tax=Paenibacillus sp. 1P07SE TaxID=3132209 RepID=UPI0039A535F5